MSAPISAKAISSTPSWWWSSAAWVISGARCLAPSRAASPTSSWNRSPARCSARSPFWSSSFCSFRSARAACSRSKGERWKHDAARAHALAGPQRDSISDRGCGRGRSDPAVEPVAAGRLGISGADLSGGTVRKIRLLRNSGALDRFDLGLLRHSLARPWRVLRARRLCDRHVSDAPDRQPRHLRESLAAGFPELPWYWYGFDMFWFAALMVILVPGLLAFCFGWLAFRSRVTGVYLSIITQAMTYALLLGFFRNDFGFVGNNGLTDFKDILGFNVQADGTRAALFALSCLALITGFLICRPGVPPQ